MLRPYQRNVKHDIMTALETHRNVMAVLPTGAGKTVMFTSIVNDLNVPTIAIAHRQELINQMSMAFAKSGMHHDILGSAGLIKNIIKSHIQECGKNYYRPNAQVMVGGVQSINNRKNIPFNNIKLWVIDECHHVLRENIWGNVLSKFRNALGLGVTATPLRTDGYGLGSHCDGLFDVIVTGPTMRTLINERYLSDYKIYAPPSDLNLNGVKITQSGDYSRRELANRVCQSQIMGDVVEHYLRLGQGKQGITFCTDIENATTVAKEYSAEGVQAVVITAKTPLAERIRKINDFRKGRLQQLVNVDLFGEGFDLPAVEVVSMARPTESYILYCQQFGRALRPMVGKSHAVIIDHVGNCMRHGLPDYGKNWTLDRRDRRAAKNDPDVIPLRTCTMCIMVYESYNRTCPYCGYTHVPEQRSTPDLVEGNLLELDQVAIMKLRGESDRIMMDSDTVRNNLLKSGSSQIVAMSAAKNHRLRRNAQETLRDSIARWAGHLRAIGASDDEIYIRFYRQFGVDILSAQTLSRGESVTLTWRIINDIK